MKKINKMHLIKPLKPGDKQEMILCPECLENGIFTELDDNQLYCHECGWRSLAIEGVI